MLIPTVLFFLKSHGILINKILISLFAPLSGAKSEISWPLASESRGAICVCYVVYASVFPSHEKLAHPILDCLRGGDKEWLVNLLYAFNSGKEVCGTVCSQVSWLCRRTKLCCNTGLNSLVVVSK